MELFKRNDLQKNLNVPTTKKKRKEIIHTEARGQTSISYQR